MVSQDPKECRASQDHLAFLECLELRGLEDLLVRKEHKETPDQLVDLESQVLLV